MEYVNSIVRTGGHALAARLAQEVAADQAHLRVMTGYFSLNGLAGLKPVIDHLVANDLPISIALGANDRATIKPDVDALFALIGCPRPRAMLCVVGCTGGLFHPKVVHLTRTDGSQLAYVGSANVTPSGFNGTNIEAGMLLDTRQGDDGGVLADVAASIDGWFGAGQPGVTMIAGTATTQQLVTDGVLGVVKPPRPNASPGGGPGTGTAASRMPLAPLVAYPPLPGGGSGSGSGNAGQGAAAPASTAPGTVAGQILIAEIGGPTRWKQANFPFSIVQNYFTVNPTGNQFVDLVPVDASGAAAAAVHTKVVNVKSKNYRLELASVAGQAYPTNGRPIAVFRHTGPKAFRYRVFRPGDPGYPALSAGLAQRYTGPARQLKRIIVDPVTMAAIWAGCPV